MTRRETSRAIERQLWISGYHLDRISSDEELEEEDHARVVQERLSVAVQLAKDLEIRKVKRATA